MTTPGPWPMTPDATCQCAANPIVGCGAAITQEDLMCDGCRAARKCPGALCASMKIDGELLPHFTMLVSRSVSVIS
jgi:hypothetical protein